MRFSMCICRKRRLGERKARAELRGFLWDHWFSRRLGYVEATFYTIEGDRSEHVFFVEPGTDGRWRIAHRAQMMKLRRAECEDLLSGEETPECATASAYEIKRYGLNASGRSSSISVPPDAVMIPETYRLLLVFEGPAAKWEI